MGVIGLLCHIGGLHRKKAFGMLASRWSLCPGAGDWSYPWCLCTGHSWDSLLGPLPMTLCSRPLVSPQQGQELGHSLALARDLLLLHHKQPGSSLAKGSISCALWLGGVQQSTFPLGPRETPFNTGPEYQRTSSKVLL